MQPPNKQPCHHHKQNHRRPRSTTLRTAKIATLQSAHQPRARSKQHLHAHAACVATRGQGCAAKAPTCVVQLALDPLQDGSHTVLQPLCPYQVLQLALPLSLRPRRKRAAGCLGSRSSRSGGRAVPAAAGRPGTNCAQPWQRQRAFSRAGGAKPPRSAGRQARPRGRRPPSSSPPACP